MELDGTGYGVCLYPTPEALAANPAAEDYVDEPFRRAMADGRGSLELAYFSFDVLEQYRNDPRFSFRFYDFGAQTVISDDSYEDESEPEHDKILMDHIGFAYDLSDYDKDDPQSPIVRRVCAFYGDLAKLSPIHQQRWRTYQVPDEPLQPHPVWWAQQGGHFPDGVGPFEKLFHELDALNTLFDKAFGASLLKSTERPADLGWILRPSQREWDAFVHQLDKLLSENLDHKALDSAGVPRKDAAQQNIGSLRRLGEFLTANGVAEDAAKAVLKPLSDVRNARQKPAHTLRKNVNDRSFVHRQVALLQDLNLSVEALRRFVQSHPANREWSEPEYLKVGAREYRF
ncbi:hypothetical protein C8N24_2843 [Solirubrobacter pauli]|uniref:Uncharacterized protein n=2 Tax=Solirubrobacter pauli TaxID=166793 RepID=A0A660LFB2_9ACTN|nr:hypothetical protein C8N24_2843 [Solirubrobacter pauli]